MLKNEQFFVAVSRLRVQVGNIHECLEDVAYILYCPRSSLDNLALIWVRPMPRLECCTACHGSVEAGVP